MDDRCGTGKINSDKWYMFPLKKEGESQDNYRSVSLILIPGKHSTVYQTSSKFVECS